MIKKLAILVSWFTLAPLTLALSFTLLYQLASQTSRSQPQIATPLNSSPAENNIEGQIVKAEISDIRPLQVANLLKDRELEPYSQYIVDVSDDYGLDYRLIPSIAMKESGGGNAARAGSYNAWGFENGRTNFTSWETAIKTVAKTLKERYVDKGLATPEEIMPIYAPPQIHNGGKWAKDIRFFYSQMETL